MSDTVEVMLDIETLGTEPGCIILSIGAVTFTLNDGVQDSFYRAIDIGSCRRYGLQIETDTLLWWLDQSDQARNVFREPNSELPDVLTDFANWLPKGCDIWAHGPTFDIALLDAAYGRVCQDTPWWYWQIRDSRTIKKLRIPALDRMVMGQEPTVPHNALDDAVAQATQLIATRRALNSLVLPADTQPKAVGGYNA